MINTLSTPCFQLAYSNTEPDDYDGEHFDDYASAAKDAQESHQRASTWGPTDREIPTPRQLPTVCVTVSCDGCGFRLDEDDEIYHLLPDQVTGVIESWEWTVHGDQALCPKCAAELSKGTASAPHPQADRQAGP